MNTNTSRPRTNWDKITPAPRCLQKQQVDLLKYLYNQPDLIVHRELATEFGFKSHAFTDVLAAGLGPRIGPALVDKDFWFTLDLARFFWLWLKKEATDEDLSEIAEIIRRNDEFGDFRFAHKLEPREFIFCALESWRGYCRDYSPRLKLDITSPEFEIPHMIADPESVQR
jgi:hypothetical protein